MITVRVKEKTRKNREKNVIAESHGVVNFTSHPSQHGVEFAVQVYYIKIQCMQVFSRDEPDCCYPV